MLRRGKLSAVIIISFALPLIVNASTNSATASSIYTDPTLNQPLAQQLTYFATFQTSNNHLHEHFFNTHATNIELAIRQFNKSTIVGPNYKNQLLQTTTIAAPMIITEYPKKSDYAAAISLRSRPLKSIKNFFGKIITSPFKLLQNRTKD
ncbi:hypothetical protein BEP19_03490 [Ammoniphilus oxalaticus]|uniref:Uncharacterized protein n=1 Tax=Ammoniphilus oxalaticus TaxID=66863 RepID=A0A419SP67_9BACL|nr:hypothetical protein [Ammoniphilus oxalaticus]RKD26001.1 hypothetical protein BEP19_03490 [Ammoniphilus oxalaticus]